MKYLCTTIGILFCLFLLAGCMSLMGINKPKTVTENEILSLANKFNVPPADCYQLDTTYVSFLHSFDTTRYRIQINNHYQPLQALYFNKPGQLVSFQINCYTGGFPNLKWDRNSIMTTFPPKQQAPVDSLLTLEKQLSFLKRTSQTTPFDRFSYDYIVVLYWSQYMGRQSKRFIKVIQENYMLRKDNKVKIIYANNDNIFARTNK